MVARDLARRTEEAPLERGREVSGRVEDVQTLGVDHVQIVGPTLDADEAPHGLVLARLDLEPLGAGRRPAG